MCLCAVVVEGAGGIGLGWFGGFCLTSLICFTEPEPIMIHLKMGWVEVNLDGFRMCRLEFILPEKEEIKKGR